MATMLEGASGVPRYTKIHVVSRYSCCSFVPLGLRLTTYSFNDAFIIQGFRKRTALVFVWDQVESAYATRTLKAVALLSKFQLVGWFVLKPSRLASPKSSSPFIRRCPRSGCLPGFSAKAEWSSSLEGFAQGPRYSMTCPSSPAPFSLPSGLRLGLFVFSRAFSPCCPWD